MSKIGQIKVSKKQGKRPSSCTEFQLHKSMLQLSEGTNRSRILDFTECKLRMFAKSTLDQDRKKALLNLLSDYKAGKVAVAWNGSEPVYVTISKDI